MRKGNWQIKNSRRAFVSATPDFTLLNSAIEFSDNPFYLFLSLEFMVRYIMRCNSCRSWFLRSVTFRIWILASKTIFWILAKYKTIFRNRENLWALTDSYLSRNNSKYFETAHNIHRILIVFFRIYLQEKSFMFQNYDIIIKAIFVHSFLIAN